MISVNNCPPTPAAGMSRHSLTATSCPLLLALLVSMVTCDTLVHVSVLFRHGHRSPIRLVPSQNYTIANTWTDGLGQLTNIGKQNEYELGQFLRNRYNSLLGSRYNASDHYARSTDMDRTLMSAQACLAGLFPPFGDQLWNSQLPWQPIPVHTRPQSEDWLLAGPEYPCPERDRQSALINSDPDRLALYAPFAYLMKRLSSGAGMQVNPDNVHNVMDTLWINKVANLTDPTWLNTSSSDWQRMWAVSNLWLREYSWTDDMVRFGSGVFINEVLHTLEGLSKGHPLPNGRKLRLYSDHDCTVASALAAVGNRDYVWPNFASCILFELYKMDTGYGVKVLFRNDTLRQPMPIRLANCSDPCPIEKTLAILGPMRLTTQQLLEKCQGSGRFWQSNNWVKVAVLVATLGLFCSCFCILLIAKSCRCLRQGRSAVKYRSLNDQMDS